MDLNELKVLPNTAVQVEVLIGENERYTTKFLGHNTGRSVFIQTPTVNGRAILIRKDQQVVLRFFSSKVACAFKTKVIHICTTPFFYLHLAYPGTVEVGEVRNAARAMAKLPMSITNETQSEFETGRGMIIDISASGARIETVQPVGDVNDVILLSGKITFGSITRLVTWEATIRVQLDKFTMNNTTASYGIEFNYMPDLEYLALIAYVNGQLVKGLESL